MNQQINLYQESLIDVKPPLRAALMLGVFLFFCLILAIGVVFLTRQKNHLDRELQSEQKKLEQLRTENQLLKAQHPARKQNPQLELDLLQLKTELAGRKPLLAYLDHFKPGTVTGFSPVIEGLARYPYQGVWLTGIRLDMSNHQVLLAGSAITADLVPAYLQHLGDKRVLTDLTFASLRVTAVKEQEQRVNFRLKTDFGAADE